MTDEKKTTDEPKATKAAATPEEMAKATKAEAKASAPESRPVRAVAKYLRFSAQKGRLVVDQIRGKKVLDAATTLEDRDYNLGAFAAQYGEGDDVLGRAAKLAPHDVGLGVGTEVGGRAGVRHRLGRGLGGGRHDAGGGVPADDLARQVGAGHDRHAVGVDVTDLADHLGHASTGAQLDPLHEGHVQGVGRQVRTPPVEVGPQALGRHREHHDLGAVERRGHVVRRGDAAGQGQAGEVLAVGVVPADLAGDLGAATPHGDVVAGVGQDHREGRPPAARPEHRDPPGGRGGAHSDSP